VIGRDRGQDQALPAKDAQTRFGMLTELGLMTRAPFRREPMYLHASNKPSEHNTGKMPRFIPVSQLRGERTGNVTMLKLVSNRIHFRPGTQSLGGT
jgi:hypothetical protein